MQRRHSVRGIDRLITDKRPESTGVSEFDALYGGLYVTELVAVGAEDLSDARGLLAAVARHSGAVNRSVIWFGPGAPSGALAYGTQHWQEVEHAVSGYAVDRPWVFCSERPLGSVSSVSRSLKNLAMRGFPVLVAQKNRAKDSIGDAFGALLDDADFVLRVLPRAGALFSGGDELHVDAVKVRVHGTPGRFRLLRSAPQAGVGPAAAAESAQ